MEETDENYVPEDILTEAEEAAMQILPEKSRDAYDKEFKMFESWMNSRKIKGIDENVLLAYFLHLQKKLAPSSLWTKYSMLRSTIHLYKKIDISKYGKLTSFLKSKSQGYKPKKSKTLERPEIEKFLNEAPDDEYLLMKVALIMGISGACRCDELVNLKIENIQDKGKYFHVVLPDTKTKKSRSFTILEEGFPVNPINLCKKYMSLRPKNTSSSRFFVFYKNGRCTSQCVGINTLSKIPSRIAMFLKLEEPALYTGHCLRRSSATLLANAGANMTTLKRHGGWKSSTVAEGYLEESVHNKIQIAEKIQGSNASASSSTISSCTDMGASGSNEPKNFTITSNSNKPLAFSFNFNINVNSACNSNK